jgi:protein gp37
MAARDLPGMRSPTTGKPFATRTAGGPRWTGKVELIPSKLDEPLRWRKPVKVFVNSMSDLFHEALPDEAIARVFAVMVASPQHTFQVLTKRPHRMREWMTGTGPARTELAGERLADEKGWCHAREGAAWPSANVWLGVSVEDQATADERIPLLLQTPTAKRFVSYEPALAAVDFRASLHDHTSRIDWLIVGGESGPGARPFDLAWLESVAQQVEGTGCALFVKQGSDRYPGRQGLIPDALWQKKEMPA